MNWAQQLVQTISGLELSPNYSYIYLGLVCVVIGFIVWAYYYIIFRKAINELTKINWLPFKSVINYTLLTVTVIVFMGSILFSFDFILDQLINIIIGNAS